MGTIVCASCNAMIDTFDDEKVSVLFAQCPSCTGEGETKGEE
ncbi:GapA-binding peptide SR1P [Bacillus fonticola]|nr:GapA-binding peptide SR1P [Bacillus fonticola]